MNGHMEPHGNIDSLAEVKEFPSYFHGNPWLDILAQRGKDHQGPQAHPALSTASIAQLFPSLTMPSQARELHQLISILMKLTTNQITQARASAQAQSSSQPTVIVVPIVILSLIHI